MQIAKWRKAALDQLPELFVDGRRRKGRNDDADQDALYEEIGRLKMELDWLKKKLVCWSEERRPLVEWAHPDLSIRRQCELLGVNRAGLYYEPRGENEENLHLMRLLDEQYPRTPFFGRRRMKVWLPEQGYQVNPKRVTRLMERIGIAAIYPKPKLSAPGEGHTIYPYLLEGVAVKCVNQVWSTDITYMRMAHGFVYLVAVMDWCSRFVLSWALSVSREVPFCIEALEKAFRWGQPQIFNSDPGAQFTREKFLGELKGRQIRVSLDGRGRGLDNIFSNDCGAARGGVLAGVSAGTGSTGGDRPLVPVLQLRAPTPKFGIPNTGGRLWQALTKAPHWRADWKSWYGKSWYGGHGKCCRSAPTQAYCG